MHSTINGDEKTCADCNLSKKNKEMHTLHDISEWWGLESKVHFQKKKIIIAVTKIQNWWRKYLRSDKAKYFWCERMLDYEDLPSNYFTDNMLNYMEKIVIELNNPEWKGCVNDYDCLSWMMDNLESAQGAYKTLPSWWIWNDIRFKTDPIIWSDYSDSSDSE